MFGLSVEVCDMIMVILTFPLMRTFIWPIIFGNKDMMKNR